MQRALILNYHEIVTTATNSAGSRFSVSRSEFVKQLDLIQELEIPVISITDWVNGDAQGDFSVILTFDDGFKSDYHIAFPILKELNVHATFFPFIKGIGNTNNVTWSELTEMHESGFCLGSHGATHTDLRALKHNRLDQELIESKRIIEQKIDAPVYFFALPYGGGNRTIEQLAKDAGYTHVLTTKRLINNTNESTALHRWNVKMDTTLIEFEKILLQDKQLLRKKKYTTKLNELKGNTLLRIRKTFSANIH